MVQFLALEVISRFSWEEKLEIIMSRALWICRISKAKNILLRLPLLIVNALHWLTKAGYLPGDIVIVDYVENKTINNI